MENFKYYLINATNFERPTSPSEAKEDIEQIMSFASSREDLVVNFLNKLHSDPKSRWLNLAKNGVMYYLEHISSKRTCLLSPEISPMIWRNINEMVAVIKVTI